MIIKMGVEIPRFARLAWCGLAFAASGALGQCGVVLQDEVVPSDGFGHRTIYEWDFDGPGPLESELLVGTDGGRVMAFNGSRWRQVGPRLSGLAWGSTVTDPVALQLLGFRGELYLVAAGSASNLPAGLFRWTGSTWQLIPLSQSGCSGAGVSGWMDSATVWNDRIVVVGQNLRCGNTSTLALAWNGTAWATVGDLFTSNAGTAICGAVYATHDGRLLIGGTIPSAAGNTLIAELVNNQWVSRVEGSSGLTIPVTRFQEEGDALYAMTSQVTIPSQGSMPIGVLRERAAGQWERWFPTTAGEYGMSNWISQMLTIGDRTYLAGSVDTTAGYVLVRDGGGAWQRATVAGGLPSRMRGIARFRDRIWAIGSKVTSGQCPNVATLYSSPEADGLNFKTVGTRFATAPTSAPQSVGSIAVTPAGLFAWSTSESGGSLSVAKGVAVGSNVCPVTNGPVARFDGEDWVFAEEQLVGNVRAVLTIDGAPVAFGTFTAAGSRAVTRGVARWTGSQWDSYLAALGTNVVHAALFGGTVYASESGGSSTTVKRWNGTSWDVVGASFASPNARLIAAGNQLYAYGPGTNVVHRLDGATWTRLASPSGVVMDATDAAGELTVALANISPQGVARFDGTAWQMYPAFGGSVQMKCVAWHDGSLYAGINWAGQPNVTPVMRYDGSGWVTAVPMISMRSGVTNPTVNVLDMVSDGGDTMHIVGTFSYIGGQTAESWIRYRTGVPRVITQPRDTAATACGDAYFSVEPEVYHDPAQVYQWLRDGQAVANGQASSGALVSGATTPYLRISNPTGDEAGAYALRITNGCGTVTTDSAALNVEPCPPCRADFNGDGGIDGADVEAFFFAWENQTDSRADVNEDGGIDGADVETFFLVWESQQC